MAQCKVPLNPCTSFDTATLAANARMTHRTSEWHAESIRVRDCASFNRWDCPIPHGSSVSYLVYRHTHLQVHKDRTNATFACTRAQTHTNTQRPNAHPPARHRQVHAHTFEEVKISGRHDSSFDCSKSERDLLPTDYQCSPCCSHQRAGSSVCSLWYNAC